MGQTDVFEESTSPEGATATTPSSVLDDGADDSSSLGLCPFCPEALDGDRQMLVHVLVHHTRDYVKLRDEAPLERTLTVLPAIKGSIIERKLECARSGDSFDEADYLSDLRRKLSDRCNGFVAEKKAPLTPIKIEDACNSSPFTSLPVSAIQAPLSNAGSVSSNGYESATQNGGDVASFGDDADACAAAHCAASFGSSAALPFLTSTAASENATATASSGGKTAADAIAVEPIASLAQDFIDSDIQSLMDVIYAENVNPDVGRKSSGGVAGAASDGNGIIMDASEENDLLDTIFRETVSNDAEEQTAAAPSAVSTNAKPATSSALRSLLEVISVPPAFQQQQQSQSWQQATARRPSILPTPPPQPLLRRFNLNQNGATVDAAYASPRPPLLSTAASPSFLTHSSASSPRQPPSGKRVRLSYGQYKRCELMFGAATMAHADVVLCVVCGEAFGDVGRALDHDIRTHPYGRLPCPLSPNAAGALTTPCRAPQPRLFALPVDLDQHVALQHGLAPTGFTLPAAAPVYCPWCRNVFASYVAYRDHITDEFAKLRARLYEDFLKKDVLLKCKDCRISVLSRANWLKHRVECMKGGNPYAATDHDAILDADSTKFTLTDRRGCPHQKTVCKTYPSCIGTNCSAGHPKCRLQQCSFNWCPDYHENGPIIPCALCRSS